MAANDVYECVVGMNQDGQKMVNVLHYRQIASDGANDSPLYLKDDWVNTMLPLYRAVMTNQTSVESLRVRRVIGGEAGSFVYPIDEEGDYNEQSLATQSCGVVALYTDLISKRGRGRIHISGFPKTVHGDGIMFEEIFDKYKALGNGLANNLPPTSGSPGFVAGLYDSVGMSFHDYVKYIVRPNLYTLRSRRIASV